MTCGSGQYGIDACATQDFNPAISIPLKVTASIDRAIRYCCVSVPKHWFKMCLDHFVMGVRKSSCAYFLLTLVLPKKYLDICTKHFYGTEGYCHTQVLTSGLCADAYTVGPRCFLFRPLFSSSNLFSWNCVSSIAFCTRASQFGLF